MLNMTPDSQAEFIGSLSARAAAATSVASLDPAAVSEMGKVFLFGEADFGFFFFLFFMSTKIPRRNGMRPDAPRRRAIPALLSYRHRSHVDIGHRSGTHSDRGQSGYEARR